MAKAQTWPKIRRRGSSWQVDCGKVVVEGKVKRLQLSFKTRTEAEAEAARRRAERKAEGNAAVTLTPLQRRQALRALKILKGSGYSLVTAAEYTRDHATPLG
ncbi:MAG: hypothetical protein V1929_09520 [bacterium]